MRQHNLTDYKISPSVFPAGKESTVTITSLGENSTFYDGYTYKVEIWAVEDCRLQFDRYIYRTLEVVCKDGKLVFNHKFEGEQQHNIKVIVPEELQYCTNKYMIPPIENNKRLKPLENRTPTLFVYSVQDDLLDLTVHKGDFHIHSCESDGHDDLGTVVGNLRRAGYDFCAITDHNLHAPSQKAIEAFKDSPDVFTILNGEEVHLPTGFIHQLSICADRGITDYYHENREKCDLEIKELEKTLNAPKEINPHVYAMHIWIANKIKEFGGMPIFAHPYWICWGGVHFVAPKLTKYLYENGNYEAFELLNGACGRETNSLQTSFYFEERANGFELPIVGNSDSHNTDRKYDWLPCDAYTLVFSKQRDWKSIREAILAKNTVAVEHYENDENFRVYGSYRLVKYANFLLKNYFPLYTSMCDIQGKLLREYYHSKDAKTLELLDTFKKQTDNFTKEFFGR